MELRTLRYFLAVAREENMTEAANVLHVTQPTLSRQIGELERELGRPLFDRTNRSTVLTEDGMRLRQRAEEIVSLVEQTEADLSDNGGELAGNIRIGAGQTRSVELMTGTFAAMRREHPHVTCELFTGNADAVEERLERGLLDFALLLEPVNLDKYEWLRMPQTDRMGVAVAAGSPWAGLGSAGPQDLLQMPLLTSSRSTNRSFDLESWSGGVIARDRLDVVGTFDLIGNAAALVKTGAACALTIDRLLDLESPDLVFLPLEPAFSIASYVVWKKYRLRSRTCEEYLKRLKKAAEGEDGQ